MADISKIKVLDGTTYDIKDATSRTYVDNAKNNYGYQYKTDVVVFGESNKYYPVYLNGGDQDIPREVMIVRSYNEQAPSDWNTATHKGGLTVKIKLNYGGWGGAEYKSVILDFAQSYSTTFAKVQAGVNSGMNAAFWLRGGGETGALYHFYSDQQLVNTRYHGTFPFVGTTQGAYIMYSGDTPESSTYKWTVPAPLTAQDINDINSRYTDKLSQDALAKANGVTNVAWDSTNKKLTKTINGTTSDVATAATLRAGLNVADGAEVNQNAFSNVKVGSTTVAADSKTDTLELVAGSNVTLTPDATNDKVTIAATDTTYSAGDGLNLNNTTFSNHRGVEYIRGTWTAASGTWTGVTADSELYDGKQIILYMPFAGSGNATLNLTLSGGGTTGAKNVYFESTTRFTTHKGQNSQLHLIYHESLVLSDGNTYSGWWYVANRDTNNNDTSTGYTRFSHGTYKNTTAAGRYVICLTKSLTEVVPVTAVNNSTATTKALTTDKFNPFEPIFYYTNNSSTTQTAANTALNVSYLWRNYSNIDLRYSFNTGTTLTAHKDIFIKATPTDGYMATLASTPIVQALPTSDDGFIYIKLGHACSTSNIAMAYEHPIYWYKDGKVRPYGRWEVASTSSYGATKLSTSTSSTATDLAATPSAVKTAYDLANTANGTANSALSGVNGNLIYDHTFTISNGVATFTPHVYQKGSEVTTNYAKSCFTWKYRLIDGSEVTLTTKNDRGCDVTITNLGYGGHVIGIFTPA